MRRYARKALGGNDDPVVVLDCSYSLAIAVGRLRPAEWGTQLPDLEEKEPTGWVQKLPLARPCRRGAWRTRPLRHHIWRRQMSNPTLTLYTRRGNFRYMCAIPSEPISMWGGCRKLVARTISGGMVRRIMSGRLVGRCKRPRATSSSR